MARLSVKWAAIVVAAILLFGSPGAALRAANQGGIQEHALVFAPLPIFQIVREVTHNKSERLSAKVFVTDTLRSLQWPLGRLGILDEVDLSQIDIAIVGTGANVGDEIQPGAVVGGFNFYDNNGDYHDVQGHDTHMLEILANRDFGGARSARIHIYRISDLNGNASLQVFTKCIAQAQVDHIKVMLCAWGGRLDPSDEFAAAIQQARASGVLIITATGNDGSDIDSSPDNWKVADANVVRVAATAWPGNNASEDADQFAGYSARGHEWADIAFPGEALVSHTENSSTWDTGTSVAAAWATVAAAIVWAQTPSQDWRYVHQTLLDCAVYCPALEDKVFAEGRGSVANALTQTLRPAMDVVSITGLKLKKRKKLSFLLNASAINSGAPTAHVPGVYRVYGDDMLLEVREVVGDFFRKIPPDSIANIAAFSSHGGRDLKPLSQ
jgi:subtilisin family serine protease